MVVCGSVSRGVCCAGVRPIPACTAGRVVVLVAHSVLDFPSCRGYILRMEIEIRLYCKHAVTYIRGRYIWNASTNAIDKQTGRTRMWPAVCGIPHMHDVEDPGWKQVWI
jgi:hypothetical protein